MAPRKPKAAPKAAPAQVANEKAAEGGQALAEKPAASAAQNPLARFGFKKPGASPEAPEPPAPAAPEPPAAPEASAAPPAATKEPEKDKPAAPAKKSGNATKRKHAGEDDPSAATGEKENAKSSANEKKPAKKSPSTAAAKKKAKKESTAPAASPQVKQTEAESGPPQAEKDPNELTPEQKKLIEENMRKALQKKQQASGGGPKASTPADKVVAALPSPTRSPAVSGRGSPNIAEVTPQKTEPPSAAPKAAARPAGKFDRFAGGEWQQFNKLYMVRLAQLRNAVLEQAKTLWGGNMPIEAFLPDIAGFKTHGNSEVVLTGVLFKILGARKNILDQYRESRAVSRLPEDSPEEAARNLTSDEDTVWLEDGTMRLRLNLPPGRAAGEFITGLVLGVKGTPSVDGHFNVSAICLPRPMPQAPRATSPAATEPSGYVALLSGLGFGACQEGLAEARERAVDFLLAPPAREGGSRGPPGPVRRVIVCGGTIAPTLKDKQGIRAALGEADTLFARLAAAAPVELLPGRDDPTNLSLPQMPLHPHLFRQVRDLRGSFKSVSNPYSCELDGLSLLGHSGQPVEDVLRCSKITEPLNALTLSLESRHLAPTAPDTLPTQPFHESDPFVIDAPPRVLFSGGHEREDHKWMADARSADEDAGTMCICVPAFRHHQAVAFVNVRDPRNVHVETF